MTRYTTVFVVLGSLMAAASVDGRGIAMLQTGSRAVRTANLAKMSDEVVAQVKRGKVTPELQQNIDEMIKLIVQIEAEITADYTAAQSHYNTLMTNLDTTTKAVVAKKTDGNTYDKNRFGCYGEEQQLLDTWEKKAQIELDARIYMEKMCHITHEVNFAVELKHFGKKTCNVSDTESLTGPVLAKCPPLEELVDARNGIKRTLRDDKANHTAAVHACDLATAAWQKALQEKNEAWGHYEVKRETCTAVEYQAENVMCEFGVALQEKCDDLRELQDFKSKVEQIKGDHHSEEDRKNEFAAMMSIKCVLKSYVDSPPAFDTDAETACKAKAENQYPHTFNYAEADIAAWSLDSTSSDQTWSCQETSVSFHGQAYKIVPSNSPLFENDYGIKSADYQVHDTTYEVNNDNNAAKHGGDPFAFCNVQVSDGSETERRDHS